MGGKVMDLLKGMNSLVGAYWNAWKARTIVIVFRLHVSFGLLAPGRPQLTPDKRSYAEIDSVDASLTQFNDQSLEPWFETLQTESEIEYLLHSQHLVNALNLVRVTPYLSPPLPIPRRPDFTWGNALILVRTPHYELGFPRPKFSGLKGGPGIST